MNQEYQQLLTEFKKLNLPQGEYAVYGSGPMVVRGMRPANDVDVVVTNTLFEQLKRQYAEVEENKIQLGDIEIYPVVNSLISNAEQVIQRAELIDGVYFMTLQDLITWKKEFGREKDLRDIKMIKQYIKTSNSKIQNTSSD